MALSADTVWEFRADGGSRSAGGGCVWDSLKNSTYKWTASGSGTDEFYCELASGGDPSLIEANDISLCGWWNIATKGSLGSLAVSEWGWGDNDTLGYNTVYVRLADGADPDSKPDGFVRMVKNGGKDYSQQAAIQLQLSDIASDGAGTGIFSATGGFTALMKGNVVYIASTGGFTAAWYEVVEYTDTNNITIDRSAGASKSGGVCNIGGGMTLMYSGNMNFNAVGNQHFIRGDAGAMVLTEAVYITLDGNTSLRPVIWGYDTVRGDAPIGSHRPLISGGSYSFSVDMYWDIFHIRITSSNATYTLRADLFSRLFNCEAINTNIGMGIYLGSAYGLASNCKASSSFGRAFVAASAYTILHQCRGTGSVTGFFLASNCRIIQCIADHNTTGIYLAEMGQAFNCVCDNNSGKGVQIMGSWSAVINSQITNNGTYGIYSAAGTTSNFSVQNNFYNNTTADVFQMELGPLHTANNPNYVDAANGDYETDGASVSFDPNIADSSTVNNIIQGAYQYAADSGSSEIVSGYVS